MTDPAIRGRVLVEGEAEGRVLYADEPLSFWGGYDAGSGEIIDRRHVLSGKMAVGRVLAIPATRGSSTTTAVLLEALRLGTGPVAIVTGGPDAFLALGSVVAGELYGRSIPVLALDSDDFARLAEFARVRITSDGRLRPLD